MSDGITITVNAQSEEAAARLQEFFNGALEGIDKLSGAGALLEELGGKLIAALSIGALIDFTKEAINTAEAMGTLSRQVGISIQTLAALKTEANANGIAWEELRMSLTHFNSVLEEARLHGGPMLDVFRTLSPAIAQAVVEGRPAEEVLRMIAQQFKQMPDGILKTSEATKLFGRGAANWVTLLNAGAEAMDRLEGKEGITPETVANATSFNRALREMHEQLELIFINVATQLLPTLNQLVAWLRQFIADADSANNATTGLTETFKGAITLLVVLGEAFYTVGQVAGTSAYMYVELFQTAWNIVKQIVSQIKTILSDIITLMNDTALTFIAAQQAMADAATGHFKSARDAIAGQISLIKGDVTSLAKDTGATFLGVADSINKLIADMTEQSGDTLGNIMIQWKNVSDFVNGIWNKTATAPKAPGSTGAPPASSGGGAGSGATTTEQLKAQESNLEYLREVIQLQEKKLATDPTLTQQERLQQMLPGLFLESSLINDQIKAYQNFAKGPATDQEKAAANREIVKLQMQQIQLTRQMVEASHPWLSAWSQVATHIKEMGNLAQTTAKTFEGVFTSAINTISENLTKVIIGTESWGQALRNIGASILNEIISAVVKLAVQTMVSMLATALFGQTLAESMAAAYAAAWAGPAMLSTVASYGGAAAAAPGELMTAMGFAPAIASLAVASRATGGDVAAGMPVEVGELGRELFVPRTAGRVLNAGDTARLMDIARGSGASGPAGSPSQRAQHFNFFSDPNEITNHIRQNPDCQHAIIDIGRRNVHFTQSQS